MTQPDVSRETVSLADLEREVAVERAAYRRQCERALEKWSQARSRSWLSVQALPEQERVQRLLEVISSAPVRGPGEAALRARVVSVLKSLRDDAPSGRRMAEVGRGH